MTTKDVKDELPESGAALRVMGVGLDLTEISLRLGITPTHTHRAGDVGPLRQRYATDMWMLTSPLDPTEPLDAHLKWLRTVLSPHYQFFSSLRDKAKVDIYCSHTCYSDQNAMTLSLEALKLFTELNSPLEVSILVIPTQEAPKIARSEWPSGSS